MSRAGSRSQVESSTKSQSKPQGGSRIESQGGARSRQSSVKPRDRQPVSQGDVDTVLVGRRVSIAVVAGNKVVKITGTIMAMGRFWVVVSVEESELPAITGTAYLNKGSIIAYIPLPSETPGTSHDSNPGSKTKT